MTFFIFDIYFLLSYFYILYFITIYENKVCFWKNLFYIFVRIFTSSPYISTVLFIFIFGLWSLFVFFRSLISFSWEHPVQVELIEIQYSQKLLLFQVKINEL